MTQTTARSGQKAYYPLFADLHGRRCIVVGGGVIAQRKIATLLRCGAQITVVSPAATQRLRALARAGKMRWMARRFRPADLRRAWLVYAATDDQAINALVFRTAAKRQIFTNVVDQKPLCSFIAPAMFTRGLLTVAVSTGGASPTVAKQIRRELEQTVDATYAPLLRLLGSLRERAKRALPSYQDRKRYFDAVARGQVFRLVRQGHYAKARRAALTVLHRYAHANGRGH